jgi:hypothetical protein
MAMKLYGSIIGFYIIVAAMTGFMAAGMVAFVEQRAFINIIYNQPFTALTEIRV